MSKTLASFERSGTLHSLMGSAFFFVLSYLYWLQNLTPYRSNPIQKTKRRPLSVCAKQQKQSSQSISRNGAKKLAPVADSVWWFLLGITSTFTDAYCRAWVASNVKKCSIQPVANLGEGLGYASSLGVITSTMLTYIQAGEPASIHD